MIEHEAHDDIAVLRLAHGNVNALDTELLQALIAALDEQRGAQPGSGPTLPSELGIVLAGMWTAVLSSEANLGWLFRIICSVQACSE